MQSTMAYLSGRFFACFCKSQRGAKPCTDIPVPIHSSQFSRDAPSSNFLSSSSNAKSDTLPSTVSQINNNFIITNENGLSATSEPCIESKTIVPLSAEPLKKVKSESSSVNLNVWKIPVSNSHQYLPTAPLTHRRITCVNFEVPGTVEQIFRTDRLPSQVSDLLVYLAREAIDVPNLFRRSGAAHDIKHILRQMRDGVRVSWTQYSFHTLANVAKRFLLSVEGGILGKEAEEQILTSMKLQTPEMKMEVMHKVIISLPLPVQSLLVLLFGVWFRMMFHREVNQMSLEAVAKSVAGSVFRNSCASIDKVEDATKAMQFLIQYFPSSALFGPQLLHYFTQQSKTSIVGVERYQYALIAPSNVSREEYVREFVRVLKKESDRHGFDLLRDVVSKEAFDAVLDSHPHWDTVCCTSRPSSPVTSNSLHQLHQSLSDKASLSSKLMDNGRSPVRHSYPCPLMPSFSDTDFSARAIDEEVHHHHHVTLRPTLSSKYITSIPQPVPHYMLSTTESEMSLFPEIDESSLSASCGPSPPSTVSNNDYIFHAVCQRQLVRMRRRSAWFLQPERPQSVLVDLESHRSHMGGVVTASSSSMLSEKVSHRVKCSPIRPSISHNTTFTTALPWLREEEEQKLEGAQCANSGFAMQEVERVYFVVKRAYGPL